LHPRENGETQVFWFQIEAEIAEVRLVRHHTGRRQCSRLGSPLRREVGARPLHAALLCRRPAMPVRACLPVWKLLTTLGLIIKARIRLSLTGSVSEWV